MNTLNKTVIRLIHGYLQKLESDPIPTRIEELEYYSYSKSALKDILACLETEPELPPLSIVMEYRDKMDRFACEKPDNSFMFSLAYDVAENIIDEIIMITHRKEKDDDR